MYNGGRRVNRYAAKMKHRRVMRDRYMNYPYGGQHTSWNDYVAHKRDYDDLAYWRSYYFSGVRKFASDCSNSRLRREFRDEVLKGDYENMYAPQGGNYRKHFDYWWTVY